MKIFHRELLFVVHFISFEFWGVPEDRSWWVGQIWWKCLFIRLLSLGVCRKPTNSPNPTQPNPTRQVGSVFKAWWVGLGYKIFFYSGSGWVWIIKLQTRQTRPDPPIFNIYLKYIIYLILFFKSAVGHLYIFKYILYI